VHSALEVNGGIFSVVDSAPDWGNTAPGDIGGTAVVLQLMVGDPDAVGAAMQKHGADVVFPIEDQFYGHREGRLRDPFGHLWIIGKVVEALSPEEIQARVDRFHDA
jgi:PhnB protein